MRACFHRLYFLFVIGTENALFTHGPNSVDFTVPFETKCPEGFKRKALEPTRKCRDRYEITNDYTLVVPGHNNSSYNVEDYCIIIKNDVSDRYQHWIHFPEICVDTRKEDSRLV